jgi:hypothetical protein
MILLLFNEIAVAKSAGKKHLGENGTTQLPETGNSDRHFHSKIVPELTRKDHYRKGLYNIQT